MVPELASLPHPADGARYRLADLLTGGTAGSPLTAGIVLDRYLPHLYRRWNEGCRDAAVLHAEITALGYRGRLRTVCRYLQPLHTGTAPAPQAPLLKIGEVTSWLLHRARGPEPRQQAVLLLASSRWPRTARYTSRATGDTGYCPGLSVPDS